MKNKKLKLKHIFYSGVLVFSLLLGLVAVQCECKADEITVTPYYEKITKQYPCMEDYISNARSKIKNNWYPSSKSFEKSATLVITVDKQGKLLGSYISNSSNDENFDNSLIEAAQKTKFSPLPDEVNEENVDIDMLFKMQRRSIFNKNSIQLKEQE